MRVDIYTITNTSTALFLPDDMTDDQVNKIINKASEILMKDNYGKVTRFEIKEEDANDNNERN